MQARLPARASVNSALLFNSTVRKPLSNPIASYISNALNVSFKSTSNATYCLKVSKLRNMVLIGKDRITRNQ
ncbi:hypothetical protein ACA910_007979 [Epithemia clementina (nom. ined.)]